MNSRSSTRCVSTWRRAQAESFLRQKKQRAAQGLPFNRFEPPSRAVHSRNKWCVRALGATAVLDRKSTRLNSSHVRSSYAVFCFKKKNEIELPVGDVLANRRPEEQRVLQHHRDLAPQRLAPIAPDVDTVDPDGARRWLVEPQHEAC